MRTQSRSTGQAGPGELIPRLRLLRGGYRVAHTKSSRIAGRRDGTIAGPCGTLSHPTAARSGLAQFSAVSITNTGGKGSRRKGKEELSRHSTLLASPQFLVAVRVRLPVPFVCNETHELGEELVGSSRYQVHLLHWLESNSYGVFLTDNNLYIKYKQCIYESELVESPLVGGVKKAEVRLFCKVPQG